MTWAPRGMSRTYSASVGRKARQRVFFEVRTQEPSGWPMMASCWIHPRSEWKVSPLRRKTKWRFPRWSMSRTCSPSWKRSRTVTSRTSSPRARLGQGQGHGAAQNGHERRDPERGAEPPAVGDPAEGGGADPARPNGEPNDKAGGHAQVARHVGLPEDHRGGEGRHQHEAECAQQHEGPHALHEEEPDGERRGEEEHADHEAPVADAIRDGARDEGARRARAEEYGEQRANHARVALEHFQIVEGHVRGEPELRPRTDGDDEDEQGHRAHHRVRGGSAALRAGGQRPRKPREHSHEKHRHEETGSTMPRLPGV